MARTVKINYLGITRTVLLHCPVSAEIRTVDSQSGQLIAMISMNNCQRAIGAKTLGWRGGSRIEPRKTRL